MISNDDYNLLRSKLIGIELHNMNQSLTWDDIQSAQSAFTAEEQQSYADAVSSSSDAVNALLQTKISAMQQSAATAIVDGYMVAGSFPIEYIARILL
jgi:hypothetical protein